MMYQKLPWNPEYRTYSVQRSAREPLVKFITEGLQMVGCRMLFVSDPAQAPFRITFETPNGERLGLIAYAFFANKKLTKNRPEDEHRFQIKYGSDPSGIHEIYQDPLGLYTTLMIGIDPVTGIFVSADPVQNNPTRFFKSIEYKDHHVESILNDQWYAWERYSKFSPTHPLDTDRFEVLVGGVQNKILDLIHFEREALGEDQGHRQWLAEHLSILPRFVGGSQRTDLLHNNQARVHQLAVEFDLPEEDVFDLIAATPRLKMAVRGWVAEEHLRKQLAKIPGVTDCQRLIGDNQPDIQLRYKNSNPIVIECKNALRKTDASGLARIDFQRSRASLKNRCSRYYSSSDFDILAGCLHSITDRWEYKCQLTNRMAVHKSCPEKLCNRVRVDSDWFENISECLDAHIKIA